jgi:hypothetical protein
VYHKIKLSFLQQALRTKGFDFKWCKWIKKFVERGSVRIRVNDDIGLYFQPQKGLCQGDLLSLVLFNIIADMLAVLIACGKEDDQVAGTFNINLNIGFRRTLTGKK